MVDPRGSGLLFFMFIRPHPYTCLGNECALYIYIVIIFIVPVLRKTVGSNALALDWLSSGASNAILGGGALGSTSKARRRAGIHMHEIRSHTD